MQLIKKANTNYTLIYISILVYGYVCTTPFFTFFGILPDFLFSKYVVWANTLLLFGSLSNLLGHRIYKGFFVWVFFFIIFYMLFLGYRQPNSIEYYYAYDFFVYMRFLLFMTMGYHFEARKEFRKSMMIILIVGILLNIISLFTTETFLRDLIDEKPLTYQLQYLLAPACFYILTLDSLEKKEKIIVIAAFGIYAVEQILFQKRLPTVRVILILLSFIYISSIFSRNKNKIPYLFKRVLLICSSLIVIVFLFSLIGFDLSVYYNALLSRFYTDSSVTTTIEEDNRWLIGQMFYDDLKKTGEFFSGRGFGGVVFDPLFEAADSQGREFRTGSEMGIPSMILKGGIPLVSFFSFTLVYIMSKYNKVKRDYIGMGSWIFIIIWFMFIYSEGFIGSIYSLNEIMVAYVLGTLLSYKKIEASKL